MARYALKEPPSGYAIRGQTATGFWTLREVLPGMWQDIGGPFKERWYAVQKAERDALRRAGTQTPLVSR